MVARRRSLARGLCLAGILLSVLIVPIVAAPTASADVVQLPASQDNTIFDESGTLSNGAGSYVFAGETNNAALRRALIAFDVASAIPPGSTINSVVLTLFCSRTRTGDTDVSLHRLLADWGEDASDADDREGTGAPAAIGDATWTHRFHDTTQWTAAGGDYQATASATTVVGNQNNYYMWSSSQMAADVQAWLDGPATNYGWIIIGNEGALKVAKRFDSRENADPTTVPVLSVDFTPAATVGACCAADGSCTVVLDPGTSCTGTYQGAGVACDPNPCPQPTGACCLPDPPWSCVELTDADCALQNGSFGGPLSVCAGLECPVVLEHFVDLLPLPAVAQPVSGTVGGVATYDMAIREVSQQLHRDLPATRVWGFGDGPSGATYPGPTIEAGAAQAVTVNWINDLRDAGGVLRTEHYLPVDTCMHGADDASPRTVVHLHGAHVPEASDGHPDATFTPGQQVQYHYPNLQLPATLWYHDHALGITRLNVYMGLAGFYLIRDSVEDALGLPSGEFEVPIVIQDRTFRPDGSLVYPVVWQEHFFGDTTLVNGKVWPYLEVKQGKYRLRIINGSTSRSYELTLSSGAPFTQIGTDGGLVAAPVSIGTLTLGPGERADAVVDFAGYSAGTEIVLTNSAPAPYPDGDPAVDVIPDVMKFVVLGASGHTAAIPDPLRTFEVIDEGESILERDFELAKGGDACTGTAWLINGLHWDDITEYPELGTTEVWRFINRSGIMHPMHMHLVMFQVLDRQLFDDSTGTVVPIGSPVPPPPEEAGWKDTVKVGPSEIARVIARFESYKGRYAYHCHILEHEDHEMMRQFETVSCGDGEVDVGESCDLGAANGSADVCCSTTCQIVGAGPVCRPSGGQCDIAESCDGLNPLCPADQFEANGAACDDALFCNVDETCDGFGVCGGGTPNACDDGVGCTDDSCDEGTGVCVNTANDANCPDDGLFCNATEFCDALADCSSTGDPCLPTEVCDETEDICQPSSAAACGTNAVPVCLEATVAKLDYNETKPGKEKMKLKWKKIASKTLQADYGDPVAADTSVALCIYDDADNLLQGLSVDRAEQPCAGKPCWKVKGTTGYLYKDKDLSADGILKIGYKAGDAGKGKADAKGKNNAAKAQSALPTGIAAALQGNDAPHIQMVTSDGFCVGAIMTEVKKDDGLHYKAQKK